MDAKNENAMAMEIVNARSLATVPANPVKVKMGINTAIVVRVDPRSAPPTSLVPASAASNRFFPFSSWLAILSDTTMELSTKRPIASASPVMEIIFNVISRAYIAANVAVRETGILMATTKAILHPPIKSSSMITTTTNAMSAD